MQLAAQPLADLLEAGIAAGRRAFGCRAFGCRAAAALAAALACG